MNPMQLELLLRQRFGSVRRGHGKHGLELITRCPICKKQKLSINAKSGLYQCWRGCIAGHVDKLMSDVKMARTELAEVKRAAPLAGNVDLPGDLIPLTSLEDSHQAIQYVKNRGFDPRMLDEQFGIRYCGAGKSYAGGLFNTTNTLMIPVYMGGILIGWQARLLYNPDELNDNMCEALRFIKDEDGDWVRPPKYFTMPGLDKGRILYNYDWARQSNLVVVCEGVFDAIAVGRCAVATFGKGVTEQQARLLKAYWDLVVILLDPGDADKEMDKLDHTIPVNSIRVQLKGYADAGETPREEIWRQIDETIRQNDELSNANIGLENYRFIV